MTLPIALTVNFVNVREELNSIGANARGLQDRGRAILPLKPQMLRMNPFDTVLVMDAVELLFAALLKYIQAQVDEKRAWDAIAVAEARLAKGQADGTLRALLHGDVRQLFVVAAQQAPIAMHAIFQMAPELKLAQRLARPTAPIIIEPVSRRFSTRKVRANRRGKRVLP